MSLEIEFVDELPSQERIREDTGHIQRAFAEALRARSGVWAKWPAECPVNTGHASSIRKGMVAAFRGGEFDAVFRNGQLYVRHIGRTGQQENRPRPPRPPKGGRPVANADFASALRARPGVWRAWPKYLRRSSARTYTSAIPAGRLHAFEAGKFEAILRSGVLHVRFVGGAR